MNFESKIYTSSEDAKTKLSTIDASKFVFTNGCFDILHIGHVTYLEKARALGDFLIVGLNSDASVKRLKGQTRPIKDQINRAAVLAGLASVDMVIIFEEDTPLDLIHIVQPNILVKGGDYTIENIVGSEFVINNGGEVKTLQFIEGQSSSRIINRLQ